VIDLSDELEGFDGKDRRGVERPRPREATSSAQTDLAVSSSEDPRKHRSAGNSKRNRSARRLLRQLSRVAFLGEIAVDARGFQIGHRAITIQWQDGKQVVVWPDELAAGNRRSTPLWSQR
jgi:hypothetical protein